VGPQSSLVPPGYCTVKIPSSGPRPTRRPLEAFCGAIVFTAQRVADSAVPTPQFLSRRGWSLSTALPSCSPPPVGRSTLQRMVTMVEKRVHGDPKNVVQQPISVHSATESGDTLATLRALRDKLAREIDECGSKLDLAALCVPQLVAGR
jgi:hypothetical protein